MKKWVTAQLFFIRRGSENMGDGHSMWSEHIKGISEHVMLELT